MSRNFFTISNQLKELGIPTNLKGYYYLRYAIELMKNDISYINEIVKRLYPEIAKQYHTTVAQVERGIRYAIETGWNRGNEQAQKKVFGNAVDLDKGKPTNSEFISAVADYLNMIESEGETE